jgi:light-regulated signal transduction histidine kinase (bacteriophytochrome)
VSDRLEDLGRAYRSALEGYLRAPDETTLSQAYALGRRALRDGLGVLDMASVHAQAIASIPDLPPSDPRSGVDAGTFFRELLSPFEMTFRGYREANERLQRVNEELLHQKEAVEIVNRELEAFSYSVSHDLRAPLRSIDGFSQALLEDYEPLLDDEGKKFLRYVRESAQEMARLIDGLLGLSRVTRAELHRAPVDLAAIARRQIERLRTAEPERQVTVVIPEHLPAIGDPALLEIVIQNLLGNAWKFTSAHPTARIELGMQSEGERDAYFVRDDGAGFDMAHAQKLFGAFQRLHRAEEFEGTGIGLATVQRIVHRHGGEVWAEGQVGRGATFHFTLGPAEKRP